MKIVTLAFKYSLFVCKNIYSQFDGFHKKTEKSSLQN